VNLSELRTALQERREDYSASDAKLNRRINQAYLDICSRRKWGWLRREYTANTHASTTVSGTGVSPNNVTLTTDSNEVGVGANLVPSPTVLGKRVLIDSAFYTVIDMTSNGQTLILDRPFTGTTSANTGVLKFVYDEVALPLGAESVIESSLFTGATSYALNLEAIQPATMSMRDKDVSGQPTSCSVIEKKPIYQPRKLISDFGALTPGAGGALTSGATYKYWYSFYDQKSGAESALSQESLVTLSSVQNRVTLPTVVARKDYVLRIYRSTAGGSIPYLLRDKLEQSVAVVDDESDDYLGARGPDSASSMFLTLYPYPDSTYQVHMLLMMEGLKLGADNDRPLFDSGYSNVLLDGAEMLMLNAEDEQSRAAVVQRRYEMGIQRMIMQDRLNFQQHVLIGRGGRRVVGKGSWLYASGSGATFKA
tara:strand:+ start:444 stop:1712 length:1269 start_codon:yes stop_codon:yes gene_type:complete